MMSSINRPELAQRAAQGAHHAGGDGVLEPVRVANGNGHLADAEVPGFAELRGGQVRRINAKDGEVRFRVFTDQMGIGTAAIVKVDLDFVRAMDDVTVGQHQSVRADDKAGTTARTNFAAARDALVDFDVHDGMADLVGGMNHRLGIRVKQFAIIGLEARRGIRGNLAVIVDGKGLDVFPA
jgi:hypothetical protein